MEKLIKIISETYSEKESRDFMEYKPTQSDLFEIAEIGRDLLLHFPSMPGACGPMSALFVARWEMEPRPPLYMVAGEVFINNTRIFGHDMMADTIHDDINQSNSSWDGHFWVVFGSHIIDVSIFRTAYSNYAPPALATHIMNVFGPGKSLLIANANDLEAMGFRYSPHAVLSRVQVTAYCNGARALFSC